MNNVIAGAYQGQKIKMENYEMLVGDTIINNQTVERFEIMNENSNTTSITKGRTKKSMVGAGAKGTVGAVIGTAIAPGIGTLIGAGAGVATSKGKTKSVTKEVTTKEFTVAIYFTNGQQCLAKLDDVYYEEFLARAFSDPNPIFDDLAPHKEILPKNTKKNNKVMKALGWLIVPYIMTPVFWTKLTRTHRILGIAWSIMAIIIAIQGR